MNYWQECIEIAFEEAGILATKEQISSVVWAVEGAHENFGMAHGHECIPNPLQNENARIKKELERERGKYTCPECKGRGYFTTYGGTFQSNHDCCKCHGKGMVYP